MVRWKAMIIRNVMRVTTSKMVACAEMQEIRFAKNLHHDVVEGVDLQLRREKYLAAVLRVHPY